LCENIRGSYGPGNALKFEESMTIQFKSKKFTVL